MPRRTPVSTTTTTTTPITPSSSSSPSRLKRSIRGVRNLLTFRHLDRWHDEPVVPCNTTPQPHTNLHADGIGNNNTTTNGLPEVAVTLTADVCGKAAMDLLTVVHHQQPPRFAAHESPLTLSSLGDVKGYVHYEPKRGVIGLGNRPPGNTKHTRSIWLTLEQYAWVVRRLQEEDELLVQQQQQNRHHSFHPIRNNNSTISPMLGILRHYESKKAQSSSSSSPTSSPRMPSSSSPISATRRLSRLVLLHPATQRITHSIRGGDPVLLLPKTLLLHAAAYIPMTKPLPPVIVTHENSHQRLYHHHHPNSTSSNSNNSTTTSGGGSTSSSSSSNSSNSSYGNHNTVATQPPPAPFQSISPDLQNRLKRYVQLAAMATHQLTLDTACHELVCLRCRTMMHDEALSYLRTIRHEKRQTFDTYPARSSLAPIRPSSAILSSTAALSSNSSSIHTTTAGIANAAAEYSYQDGYVAVDDERQEIIVTFPGTTTNGADHHSLYTTSFATVPWHEEEGIYTPEDDHHHGRNDDAGMMDRHTWRHGTHYQYQQHNRPWVLEAAAVAWRRCEMTVATALMRLCRITPCHYRVVIIGHALGGAVAALCASSLVMTGLLVDRPVTLCAIGPPRTGSHAFVSHLAEHVETIRITHPEEDPLSHLPPRTSGLVHFGTTTVVLTSAINNTPHPHAEQDIRQQYQFEGKKKQNAWILRNSSNLGWIEDQISHIWPPSVLPRQPLPSPPPPPIPSTSASLKSAATTTHNHDLNSPYTIWNIHLHAKACQSHPMSDTWLRVG